MADKTKVKTLNKYMEMIKKVFIIYLLFGVFFKGAVSLSAQEQKDEPQWEKHLEFSHVNTSGNTETIAMSTKLDIAKEGDKNRYFVKGTALYGEDNNEKTQNKWSLDSRWERKFTKRLFGFLSAIYLTDEFSGYDYRVAAGPGLGYDIIKSKKHSLKSLLSSLYYYDREIKIIDDPNDPDNPDKYLKYKETDNYISGKAEIDYSWQIAENLKFDQTVVYLASSEDNKKYFTDSETALKVKVNKHISLGISYTVAYQNILPSPDKEHTDTTFLTSLIIDF